jgi:type IV pilus secretin PilQ/predicted competence protein
MKKFMAAALTALLVGNNPLLVFAAENATVKSVRVSAESVYITTDRPVQYKSFTTETPPRLVVELQDSRLKTLQEIPVNGSALSRVRTGQFQPAVSRVVMDLTQKTAYEITRKGNELVVMFGARKAAAAPAVKDAPAAAPAPAKVIAPTAPARTIEMTLEAAPVKPSEAGQPAASPMRARQAASNYRIIMENLPRDPITFDYSEADVREVIDMLAAKAGLNIIYGDDVSGTITISLTKVPFEEAFKTVLNVRGLAARQAGDNILRIASPNTLLAEQKKSMLQTRVFFLNYSKASEIKPQLDSVAAAEKRTANCIIDEANNALVVTDSAMGMEDTARLIKSLDRRPRQVVIEAKFVEMQLQDDYHLGIQWYAGSVRNGVLSEASVQIPFAQTIYGAFSLGKVTSNSVLEATLLAAAEKGKAKVLSDPKITTLNNKEANINITEQTPYTTEEWSATTPPVRTIKSEYVTTGIILKVTPVINSDGRILMKIKPSVSQVTATTIIGAAPGIDTREADTNVIVKDGETIVIGGLIKDMQSTTVFKIPLLGDIPLLGWLFRKKSVIRSRIELLIFVTPRIMED